MDKTILNTVYQNFIDLNLNADVKSLALKKNLFPEIDTTLVIQQIQSKLKAKTKLPSWFNSSSIYYPKPLHIEQTSSEITAHYKATLVEGDLLLDLTMGFGVDTFYFSKKIAMVIGCEINKELFEIVNHNFVVLGASNIVRIHDDGLIAIERLGKMFDWIFIDPSRRHDVKGKVFRFEDCLPNVVTVLDKLLTYTQRIMIKSSPLIDITAGLKELKCVQEIYIVAVKNELKELIWILNSNTNEPITVSCVNLDDDNDQSFHFNWGDEESANPNIGQVMDVLYEPNVSLLKSGAFSLIAERFKLSKIHQHSHLYSSKHLIDFPGRTFIVTSVHPYNKKSLKKVLPNKANVSTRNFPKSVAQIRRELSIKDGGADYLFFTKNHEDKYIVIWCNKPSVL